MRVRTVQRRRGQKANEVLLGALRFYFCVLERSLTLYGILTN